MKTTHNEIEISYNEEKDRWDFELRGRSRSAQSLTKAKEAIDKEPKEKRTQTFPKFDAYLFRSWGEENIVTVTSLADDTYRTETHFWTAGKDKSRSVERASDLYPVNAHNDAIIFEIRRVKKEIAKLEEEKGKWHAKLKCATAPKELE